MSENIVWIIHTKLKSNWNYNIDTQTETGLCFQLFIHLWARKENKSAFVYDSWHAFKSFMSVTSSCRLCLHLCIYIKLWTALLTESRGPAVDLSHKCFQKQMKSDWHPSRCVIYICICNQRKLCLHLIKTQLNPTHQYESSV